MAEQSSPEQPNPGAASGGPTTSEAGQGPTLAELQAQLEATSARVKALSDENARHRNAKKEAERAAAEALASKGEFEPLYKEATAKLGELEPKAHRYEALVERLTKRVEAKSGTLSASAKFALANMPNVEDRLDYLEALEAEQATVAAPLPATAAPLPKATPSGTPAAGKANGAVDIRAELGRGRRLDELERAFPRETAEFLSSQTHKPSSPLAALFRRPATR